MSLNKMIVELEQAILNAAGEAKISGVMSSDRNHHAKMNGVVDLLGEMIETLQEVKAELGIKTAVSTVKESE
jgi:hypothetical protein